MNDKKNLKLFKLLNDEFFWAKYYRIALNRSTVSTLSRAKAKYTIPNTRTLTLFIEDYRFITWDTRDDRAIIVDLLSE